MILISDVGIFTTIDGKPCFYSAVGYCSAEAALRFFDLYYSGEATPPWYTQGVLRGHTIPATIY